MTIKKMYVLNRGSISILVMLMTLSLILVFSSLSFYLVKQLRHNEILRHIDLASQSTLNTYDRFLFERYSVLATDLDQAHPGVYLKDGLKGRAWQYEPLLYLSDPEVFLSSAASAVKVAMPEMLVAVFKNQFEHFRQTLDTARQTMVQFGNEESQLGRGDDSASEVTDYFSGLNTDFVNEEVKRTVSPKTITDAIETIYVLKEAQVMDVDPAKKSFQKIIPGVLLNQLPSRSYEQNNRKLSFEESLSFSIYVNRHFRNRTEDHRSPIYGNSKPETYFDACEYEYLLYGYDAEVVNASRAYAEIYLIRLAGNVVHVATCAQKRLLIDQLAGAVSLVFYIPPPVTTIGLTLAWGAMESKSDMDRLLKGASLPWIRQNDQDWKTGFSGRLDPQPSENDFKNESDTFETGANYQMHLNFLLMSRADMGHVLRGMDLIVINQSLDSETPLNLEKRSVRHLFKVDAGGGLPEIIWEDGYGME